MKTNYVRNDVLSSLVGGRVSRATKNKKWRT